MCFVYFLQGKLNQKVSSINELDSSFEDNYEPVISTEYKYSVLTSLTPEEKSVIDSCEDFDLKHILILNRQKNMSLIEHYKKFKDLLIECQSNMSDINRIIHEKNNNKKSTTRSSKAWRLGAPYFKDKLNFPAPLNDEALQKKLCDEQTIYDSLKSFNRWSSHECDSVTRAVKLNYSINTLTHIRNEIKKLEGSNDRNKNEKIIELQEKQKRFEDTDNLPIPPLGSDERINWIRVAEVFFRDKHTDFECRSMWHMFLHPQLNKSPWRSEETNKMLALVKKHKRQNWVEIAKELGTNRTCFSVFINYINNFHSKLKKGGFTPAEDKKLANLVRKFRVGDYIPWTKIARHFRYRERSQLHHRFKYFLNHVDKKQGKFSLAEDCLIYICVEKFGMAYHEVTEHLKDRSRTQIRTRYITCLKLDAKKNTWTEAEDDTLIRLREQQTKMDWTTIAQTLRRTPGQTRQRYHVIKKYLEKNSGSTIMNVPRRIHVKEENNSVLKQVANIFGAQNVIPTLEEIGEILSNYLNEPLSSQNDSVEDIDVLLYDFFLSTSDQSLEILSDPLAVKRVVDYVEYLMNFLKVDVDIPKNLAKCPHIDSLDKKLLSEIRTRKRKKPVVFSSNPIKDCIAPNFYTTNGMRALLERNFKFRSDPVGKIFGNYLDEPDISLQKFKCEINNDDSESTILFKETIEMDRKLFFSRFVTLFDWPGIISLESPHKDLVSICKPLTVDYSRKSTPTNVTKTYSRKRGSQATTDTSQEQQSNKVIIVEEDGSESRHSKKSFSNKTYGTAQKILTKKMDLNIFTSVQMDESKPCSSTMAGIIKDWYSDDSDHESYNAKESTSAENLCDV
uniref:snRNA-activating protein complex subunit 4 isoform X2 n=1 Tax=Diabrotica virgifera virgifera TaxID=50390 RepID=A0A6P7GB68_DIAVI